MLVIRLQRIGKKHQPTYRLVVVERRSRMIAPPVEDLGTYNPASKQFQGKKERITSWISKGAKPTITVHNLLVKHAFLTGPKKAVKINKPKAAEVVPA